ncbi:MAG: efflux RND transporter periplasmic adaptor subunit [Flavobacteriales bacterium]|nr:efflux RND transporter periplasmic adaptor subunit [Flavobacteriales bacterium]
MNTSKLKKALYVIIPIALIAIVAIRLKGNKEITEQKVYLHDEQAALNVVVDTIRASVFGNGQTYLGNFEPYREAKIGAELPGKVTSLSVEEGDRVRKDQELIRLDDALLRHQLEGINVKIEGLEADVARFRVLADADAIQGVQLEKTQLALKGARTEKKTVEEQLSKTIIRAPFDAVVTAKMTEVGAFAGPGMPLLQLTDITQLKLTIQVAEADLAQFRQGQIHPVQVKSLQNEPFSGTLTMIGSKANMANSFPVKFLVQNTPEQTLKAGMFGEVSLQENEATPQLSIPASAVMLLDGNNSVYQVIDGKAKIHRITVGERSADRIIVASGLKEGDVIVTQGLTDLRDGANVNIK